MRLKMKLRFVVIFLLSIGIFGCGDDSQKSESSTTAALTNTSTDSKFDSYLKFKRINVRDDNHKARLLADFNKRIDLAAAIEKESLLDNQLIQAELEEFRKEMLISRYFEKFLKDKVTDQAVQNYYNTHEADYQESKVHVAHLLIRTNPKMTEEERKAKLTMAQEAYSKLRTGVDFAKIAEEYSEDKISAKKGGDLGWIKEGSIDKRFSKVAFETKANELSEPFETTFGFHIVKVLDEPKTIKKPLKAVSGDIRYQLRNKAKKAELSRLLSAINK